MLRNIQFVLICRFKITQQREEDWCVPSRHGDWLGFTRRAPETATRFSFLHNKRKQGLRLQILQCKKYMFYVACTNQKWKLLKDVLREPNKGAIRIMIALRLKWTGQSAPRPRLFKLLGEGTHWCAQASAARNLSLGPALMFSRADRDRGGQAACHRPRAGSLGVWALNRPEAVASPLNPRDWCDPSCLRPVNTWTDFKFCRAKYGLSTIWYNKLKRYDTMDNMNNNKIQ